MNRIELTKSQLAVLKKQINGKYSPFLCTDEEMKDMNDVIEMASKLEEELDAYDESGDNLMLWFLNKYEEQG